MNQAKSQTKGIETAGTEAIRADATSVDVTRTEAVIMGGGDEAIATVAYRSDPAGKVAGQARDEGADAAEPKQAGKRKGKGETGTGSDEGDPKLPKNKVRSNGDATSKAKPKAKAGPAAAPASSKLDHLVALLRTPGGASLPELQSATGWQIHSIRGAMAGALRKKGYNVTSEKPEDGLRRYRIREAS